MPSKIYSRSVGFAEVKVPGKGASLAKALAEGRCTGHFKLQNRDLTEVMAFWCACGERAQCRIVGLQNKMGTDGVRLCDMQPTWALTNGLLLHS